jgi:hypothetical protein
VRTIITAIALALSTSITIAGEQTRIYDANGRSIGTATTSGNITTFRNERGQNTGTATTSGNTTTFRDNRGSITGKTIGPASPFSTRK